MRISRSTAQRCRETPSNSRAPRARINSTPRWAKRWAKMYVAKYFPPESKAKAVELVNNLLKAYDADIRTLTWMTPGNARKSVGQAASFRREDRLS